MQRASRRRPSSQPFRRRVPGQPAELLQRRPDLLAASAQLDAANARRQQAMAEWFPRLFLGAVFGRESIDLNGIGPRRRRASPMSRRCWRCRSSTPDARRRSTTSPRADNAKPSCATRTRSCARSRTSRTRSSRSTTNGTARRLLQSAAASADAALGRAQSLYDRGQIDLLPLLDAQRVAAGRAGQRKRQQHATAARQRATVQGARRRLAGVRARRRSRCVRQPEFANIMKLRRSLRGTIVNPSLSPHSSSSR